MKGYAIAVLLISVLLGGAQNAVKAQTLVIGEGRNPWAAEYHREVGNKMLTELFPVSEQNEAMKDPDKKEELTRKVLYIADELSKLPLEEFKNKYMTKEKFERASEIAKKLATKKAPFQNRWLSMFDKRGGYVSIDPDPHAEADIIGYFEDHVHALKEKYDKFQWIVNDSCLLGEDGVWIDHFDALLHEGGMVFFPACMFSIERLKYVKDLLINHPNKFLLSPQLLSNKISWNTPELVEEYLKLYQKSDTKIDGITLVKVLDKRRPL